MGRGCDYKEAWKKPLGADGGGGDITVYIGQNSSNYTFRSMNFIVYKLYLN